MTNNMNKNQNKDYNQRNQDNDEKSRGLLQSLSSASMSTLIIWNINKALESNPALDLKTALKDAQERLEIKHLNVSSIVSQEPDERHLSCALLAWQHVGHNQADSLFDFVISRKKVEPKPPVVSKSECGPSKKIPSHMAWEKGYAAESSEGTSASAATGAIGPVLKLPATPKVVVPVYNMASGCGIGGGAGLRKTGQDIKARIEKACCLESGCVSKLQAVDKETKELRQRLAQLARREAQRIELLERAETAWKDVELGYMRRHRACFEKEQDIIRQSNKTIEQRNADKETCAKLVKILKPRGENAEKARNALKQLEGDVCGQACEQLRLSELSAKEDAILAELQCKSNQQDRDLQFKEQQARRKLRTLESELESSYGLMYEVERSLKAELQGFKDQLQHVSTELFDENEAIKKTKQEIEELLAEKKEITEDLEGCQVKCDKYMQKKVDELKSKKEKFEELKTKVLECQCKLPIETAVQVKRTPSLAALCSCSPEDRAVESCSCTSLRSRLLTDLFSNLFGGLHSEMYDTSIRMPCQMLKCLEDSFNWDKTSVVKSNIRDYFAKLLCGELDIAIINSIENYHAKWVGNSCADIARPIPDLGGPDNENWEDRALARKAHWMAQAMAEQMFNEKVNQIMDQAKEIIKTGPPPCTCKPPNLTVNTAVYQCLVDQMLFSDIDPTLTTAEYVQTPQNPTLMSAEYAPSPQNLRRRSAEHDLSSQNPTRMSAEYAPPPQIPTQRSDEYDPTPHNPTLISVDYETTSQKPTFMSAEYETILQNPALISVDYDTNPHDCNATIMTVRNNTQPLHRGPEFSKTRILFSAATNTPRKKASVIKKESKLVKEDDNNSKTYWRRTQNDVIMLRAQIEGLKKDSIKKQDLKAIEKSIKQLVQRASGPDHPSDDIRLDKESKLINENNKAIPKRKLSNKQTGSEIRKEIKRKVGESYKGDTKFKRQYAVNMCFCGIHKESTRSKEHAPNEIPKENLAPENKSFKNLISQITSVQSNPIQKLQSEEKKTLENRTLRAITSEKKMTCGSDCACFNKIPSCSSIDKFLDTLLKWKYDINELPDFSKEFLLNSNKNVTKSSDRNSSQLHDVSAIVCHSIFTKNSALERTVLKKPGNEVKKDNDYVHGGKIEFPTTVSEYMGAVNLEKSNDQFCKGATSKNKDQNIIINNQTDSKHNKMFCKFRSKLPETHSEITNNRRNIKSEECYQRKVVTNYKKKNKSQDNYNVKKSENNDSSGTKSESRDKMYYKSQTIPSLPLTIDKDVKKICSTAPFDESKINSDNNFSAPDKFKCSCDYQIKLIGVTLTDINCDKKANKFKQQPNETKESYSQQKILQPLQKHCPSHEIVRPPECESINYSYPSKTAENYDLFKNNLAKTDITSLPQPLPQGTVKFEELKSLTNNKYGITGDMKQENLLNTNSFIDGFIGENCVCCVNSISESKELEENMFHLLKEHITKRLECLKDPSQSSYYCLKPDEENDIVTSIFKKIKQTINDSTRKIQCKCSEEINKEGSWQRAYNLLQEYLKMKISRAQCTCSSVHENKEQTILPQLTEKVCHLIENDFERLKNIFKVKYYEKSPSNQSNDGNKFLIPEKEVTINNNKEKHQINSNTSKTKELEKKYVIVTNSMSAQAIPKLETKSCETLKTIEVDKLTVETQKSAECSLLKTTCSTDCNLLDASKKLNSRTTQYSNSEKELNNNTESLNNTKDILKKFKGVDVELKQWKNQNEEKNCTSLPYIGHTIDCTCTPNLGSCICSKSKIIENNFKIDELWKKYTKPRTKAEDVSYIMKNIHKDKEDTNSNAFSGNNTPTDDDFINIAGMTDNKTSTNGVGLITLKDSREHVNKQSVNGGTNTEDVESLGARTKTFSDEECFEAYVRHDEPPKKKSVHFLQRSQCKNVAEIEELKLNYPGCACSKVPVCHIKMLVENIETKLANSECTCDSLSAKVCPVHSKSIE